MNNIINKIEKSQMEKKIIFFRAGDFLKIKTWVFDGNKKRLQIFEGIVIAIRNRQVRSSFTIRKISNGEGIERTFKTYSPIIESIILERKGMVRKSKLYYLRTRTGKSAKVKERIKK